MTIVNALLMRAVGITGLGLLIANLSWNLYSWGVLVPWPPFPVLDVVQNDVFWFRLQYLFFDISALMTLLQFVGICMVGGYVIFWRSGGGGKTASGVGMEGGLGGTTNHQSVRAKVLRRSVGAARVPANLGEYSRLPRVSEGRARTAPYAWMLGMIGGSIMFSGSIPILRLLIWAEPMPNGYALLPLAALVGLAWFLGGALIAEGFGR